MNRSFLQHVNRLKMIIYRYDGIAVREKEILLLSVRNTIWKTDKALLEYHDILLFLVAHPENNKIRKLAEKELLRISSWCKKQKFRPGLQDSGLPFTHMIARYSHDLLIWLNHDKACSVQIDSYEETGTDLNSLLKPTLPAVLHNEISAGQDNHTLLDNLGIHRRDRLSFLLSEFSKLNRLPYVKDLLWDSLKCFVDIRFRHKNYSRSYNRIPVKEIFYQSALFKHFDHDALLGKPIPRPSLLNEVQRSGIIEVIKRSQVLMMRETDPSSYMDENSLRVYEMERGVCIAIYGIQASRQLVFESYIGYTLFKNGLPGAYGGSWVFGRTAMFGLNIFEPYRGGESGYLMFQVLRVYKQVFGLTYIEVEAYQFGYDNPDGIRSGAFWFYYRFGFRPIDKRLDALASKEYRRIKTNPDYRCPEKVLQQFTASNIALQLGSQIPLSVAELTGKITTLIAKQFKGDNTAAVDKAVSIFCKQVKLPGQFSEAEKQVLDEIALLALTGDIKDRERSLLLLEMIRVKPHDPYRYNKIVHRLFG